MHVRDELSLFKHNFMHIPETTGRHVHISDSLDKISALPRRFNTENGRIYRGVLITPLSIKGLLQDPLLYDGGQKQFSIDPNIRRISKDKWEWMNVLGSRASYTSPAVITAGFSILFILYIYFRSFALGTIDLFVLYACIRMFIFVHMRRTLFLLSDSPVSTKRAMITQTSSLFTTEQRDHSNVNIWSCDNNNKRGNKKKKQQLWLLWYKILCLQC